MADMNRPKVSAPGRRRWIVAAIPLLMFLVLAGIFLKQLAQGGGSHDIPSVLIGRPAPVIDLPPLEGLRDGAGQVPGIATEGMRGGVTVLNVWASWCAPCRAEHPVIMQLAQDPRVRVIGLNYKDDRQNALRFLGQLGNPFAAVGVDDGGKAAIEWGVYGVPETFVIDAQGVVRYKHVGPLTQAAFEQRLQPEIEKALAAGP